MNENQNPPYQFVAGRSEQSPTLLLLHGTGGNEHSMIDIGRAALPGANLLSPRGRVLENGMPRFFRRLAEGVFDLDDLRLRTQQMDAFLREARQKHGLTDSKMVALGYSNGANIAASLLLTYPDALQGAVLIRAMLPSEPMEPGDLRQIPILLLSGVRDSMVPRESIGRLETLLKQRGAGVTTQWLPTGHQMTEEDLLSARSFLSEHFGEGPKE
jgi:phospholipase/carboxylesterase